MRSHLLREFGIADCAVETFVRPDPLGAIRIWLRAESQPLIGLDIDGARKLQKRMAGTGEFAQAKLMAGRIIEASLNPGEPRSRIDLTIPGALSLYAVRELVRSKDDTRDRRIIITTTGNALLADADHNLDSAGILLAFERWKAGSHSCGEFAARKNDWIAYNLSRLIQAWPDPKSVKLFEPRQVTMAEGEQQLQ